MVSVNGFCQFVLRAQAVRLRNPRQVGCMVERRNVATGMPGQQLARCLPW
jgi:hypothetical protein